MNSNLLISHATPQDIPSVLALQSKYLVSNLTAEEKKEGFVTTPFTEQQILEVIALGGLFVAKDGDDVVSYVYAASWEYFSQWAIFPYMLERCTQLSCAGQLITMENSFQYGPVCIDKKYRGTGLLLDMFECMRLALRECYPISITFINAINERSIRAHTQKLKWVVIDEFQYNGNTYLVLAYDMRLSVR